MTFYLLNDHKTGFLFCQNFSRLLNNHHYPLVHRQLFEIINFPKCHIRFKSIIFTGEKEFSGKKRGLSIKFPPVLKNLIEYLINNKFFKNYIIPKAIFRRTFFNFWNLNSDKDKYVIFIRDPREIIISGYLYHKHTCKENWCISKNANYFEDWEHLFSEESKLLNKDILNKGKLFSKDESYQTKLNKMSVEDGIIFEMQNVAYLTIMGIYNFKYSNNKNVLKIFNEDLIFDFENTLVKIINFFGFKNKEIILKKCDILRIENLVNKNDQHVTNLNFKKDRYAIYWNNKIQKKFEETFPKDLLSNHIFKK